MVAAFLTYTLNVYPQGGEINRKLDSFVKDMMSATLSPFSGPTADILSEIDRYKQEKERDCYEFGDKWQPMKIPKRFFCLL